MAKIEALLFDFGGTLDVPGCHWLDRFLEHYRQAGLLLGREELDRAYALATEVAYRQTAVRRMNLSELLRHLVDMQLDELLQRGPAKLRARLAEAGAAGRDRLAGQISGGFVAQSRASLARAHSVLSKLASLYRIGVVSNFYGNLDRVLDQAGLADLIDTAVDSVQVDAFKPDPRIFEVALERLGIPASRAAMIGDSPDKDCAPAKRLGMVTVWLRGPDAPQHESSGVADYEIRSLEEVAGLDW